MPQQEKIKKIESLSRQLGITFKDNAILQKAITHTSYANERKNENLPHNERLEFLGDAVLDLVVSEYLFRQFTNLPEGDLTKARASVVCEQTLAKSARKIGLGEYLLLGKGEAASGGRERISIMADAFEALIGAIYLDSGFNSAKEFVLKHLAEDFEAIQRGEYTKDFKTLLQEIAQRAGNSKVSYEVVAESGPDHCKVFEVVVNINNEKLGSGSGKSKKEAEQNAARQALRQFKLIND